ncbi:MAG: tRNA epoxyqueuosine(34) reductase QueG [Caloramator sp.]|nr:tRNA epoxyqueuosine(34) reductase QueG [Caloramator sp.]
MIRERIVEYANSIGIDCIGFSDIFFSEFFIERLKERKTSGHLSGFENSNENLRVDVNRLLEGAKTIISIAIPYKTVDVDKTKPYLSKSSFGIDYHKVMNYKLKSISEYITNEFKGRCVYYVDTGCLHDREIAKKCGIGFYGKNTSIITKKYGSFVFLGEIITDLYIKRDIELESLCKDCTLCIDVCPTKALERPYYLNARKCLSFITQKKDIITDKEMEKMGLRLYGCDTCQDVCPYNKKVKLSNINEFYPKEWNFNINPYKLLNMTNKEFRNLFGLTSAGWIGKKKLQRNMIIALGNSNDKEYIPLLETKLDDDYLKYYAEKSIKKLRGD